MKKLYLNAKNIKYFWSAYNYARPDTSTSSLLRIKLRKGTAAVNTGFSSLCARPDTSTSSLLRIKLRKGIAAVNTAFSSLCARPELVKGYPRALEDILQQVQDERKKENKTYRISILLYIFFVFICSYSTNSFSHEKMKLYALYTPSHEILKDKFFLPSIQDDFDIILEFCDQTCPSAKFMSEGWTETTMRKVDLIIRAIKENWGSIFIFSDVDIQFFSPIENTIIMYMHDKDIVMQRNTPSGVLCTGFFACRGNEKTLQLWTDVKKEMQKSGSNSDQNSLNHCIKKNSKKNPYNITWDYLPNSFFGGGTLTGSEWRPGLPLPIPRDIMMHHANWTKGIKNKIAQLRYVRKMVENKRNKRSRCAKKGLAKNQPSPVHP